ncbi:MAG TPA: sulfatase [Candidatus Hydrogenedentes bacterium]|nr:sulfatase [Candidatus Hydrogenedentota bacterium]
MRCISRRSFLAATAALALPASSAARAAEKENRRLNVLFLAVDDLKPNLGCYGDPIAITPNIDKLAASGVTFLRAYCQQAVCSPSRTSLLTGLRPDTTRVYDLNTHFRKTIPDVITLPQCFRQEGYHTQSFGKIYHGGLDDPASWSVKSFFPEGPQYLTEESKKIIEDIRKEHGDSRTIVQERDEKTGIPLRIKPVNPPRGPSWEAPDCADDELRDGQVAAAAIAAMRQLKDRPFFLAAGFFKPHLPFVAPKRYFDAYDKGSFTLPQYRKAPQDAPPFALTTWGELRHYSDIPDGNEPLSDEKTLELIHAYYAAASYTDAQIGRVVDELDRLGIRGNTVIVLWGDHGWHLGDHGQWCKHTNFEQAARAPLLFSAPGLPKAGARSPRLAEFVDIYPTLCDLCGVTPPPGLEGVSLVPVLRAPDRSWKKAAFSQYPRNIPGHGDGMGYSLRTERYRYTEWRIPADDGFRARELYDYDEDPLETRNLAEVPEYAGTAQGLHALLAEGWRGALPDGYTPE